MANNAQNQVYDNLFKRLIEGQYKRVIPLLFPGLEAAEIQELTIEILLPPRRADKVYLISSARGRFILHLEIEVSPRGRGQVSRRMLIYHAVLLEKYNENDEGIPILTCVLYPFRMPEGEPRLIEEFEGEEVLRFHHQDLLLKTLDARLFTDTHAVPLYGLLPAMEGTSEELLLAAIEDMINYYGEDEEHLRDELLCFMVLLQRARRLPPVELENVLRRIRMYDPLLEEDPWVQSYGRRREAEGELRGELMASRSILINIVKRRFPALAELAEAKAAIIEQPETLGVLIEQITMCSSEQAARVLLDSSPLNH